MITETVTQKLPSRIVIYARTRRSGPAGDKEIADQIQRVVSRVQTSHPAWEVAATYVDRRAAGSS